MRQSSIAGKTALAGLLTALAVTGSLLSFPVAGSKCAPVQHMVNILAAVTLGPWWGVGIAFGASLLRLTCAAETFGSSILGGLAAYPVAKLLMGAEPAGLFVYIAPFFISTAAGSILAFVLITVLERGGALGRFKEGR